jgi:PAS domain S-box-containing protein
MQASSVTRSDTGLARNGHKQLTEITATLHAVVENLDGFIWTIDKNRQYLVLNSHFRKKVKELSGAEIKPGSHVVDFTSLLNATPQLDWEKLYQTGFKGIPQQFVSEFMIQHKPAFFEISVTPIEEDGKITALTCFVNDVTERKKTEQALQQSELKFRSLIENSSDIITMANAEGNFFYGSPSAKKIMGYDEQDYMGRHVCSFIHPDSQAATVELLQNMVKYPDQLFTIDLKVFHKDGSTKWVQGLASNMLQVPGVNALVGNFRDITERKKAEELIRESEYLYKNLFNKGPLPIFVSDAESLVFLEVNEAAVQHYGYSRQEFLTMTAFDVMPHEDQQEVKQLLADQNYNQHHTITRKHIKKNKEIIFVEVLAHVINYKGRNAWLVVVNDITEKIRLEHQLIEEKVQRQREITKAAIDAQEKERETLGRELHDNITQILSTARLCLSCAKDNPAQQTDMLQRGHDNITSAIEEIRRLSRSMIETFHREVGLKLSVHDLIENISLARNCDITLDYSVPDEQQLDDKLKTTIFRIVQEQLNNIIKHADATVIKIAIVQEEDQLQMLIEDNGKGFDTMAKRKGIGITNMITRAELFNGRLKIDAAPGRGCRMQANFNIKL